MGLFSKLFPGRKKPQWNAPVRDAGASPDQHADPTSRTYRLFNLSNLDPWLVSHACESVSIMGEIGGGKSSGSGAAFARAYLSAGMGALWLCVKADEREVVERYAAETGRSDSLIVVSPQRKWRCNLLDYVYRQPGVIGSKTERVTNVFSTISEVGDRGERGGGKNDKFFERATKQLIRNAVEICGAARGTISVSLLHQIITSAPRTHAEVHDPTWQESSLCYQLIVEGDGRAKTAAEQNDFDLAGSYFLRDFCEFPPETRGSVLATWGAMADPLLRGQMAQLFGGETNFVPDLSFHGAIIVLDLPVKVYGAAGAMLQAAFKHVWQLAAEQRDVKTNPRPTLFFADEFHELLTETDTQFFATARSSRICSVVLSQNLSNYYAAVGGESGKHRVEGLLGNIGLKVFHANGHAETNKWASSLFAKDWQVRTNFSANRGEQQSASGGGSDMLESNVLESEFTRLKKGGPENGFRTEAILFQGGRVWKATGTTALRTIFRQKGGSTI
jgi:type IV secretory pathway TraG/TraD family ATPase VirD4